MILIECVKALVRADSVDPTVRSVLSLWLIAEVIGPVSWFDQDLSSGIKGTEKISWKIDKDLKYLTTIIKSWR